MNIPNLETVIVFSVLTIAGVSFLNGLFICFYGIKLMDKYLPDYPDYRRESESPLDGFERMHKYSLLHTFAKRKAAPVFISAWLYFTCFTLIAHWFVFLASALAYYFEVDLIKIISFGLSKSR